VSGKVTVVNPEYSRNEISKLEIIGIDGKVLISSFIKAMNTTLDVSKLPAGIYGIRVTGKSVQTGKIVKLKL
jgi:hypothetical protein